MDEIGLYDPSSQNRRKITRAEWETEEVKRLQQLLSAAEKERDEAIAQNVLLRDFVVGIAEGAFRPEIRNAAYIRLSDVGNPPAALSHLRQEIRREALLQLADLMDKGAGMSAAGLRDLAEQEKQG